VNHISAAKGTPADSVRVETALNDAAVNKNMTIAEARAWLKDATLDAYELSPLLIDEIRRVAR
jgi:hypothetical protein